MDFLLVNSCMEDQDYIKLFYFHFWYINSIENKLILSWECAWEVYKMSEKCCLFYFVSFLCQELHDQYYFVHLIASFKNRALFLIRKLA